MDEHESTATEIPGARKSYCQREADSDGSVDRVATIRKYLRANLACQRILRGDHAGGTEHGMSQIGVTDNRGFGRLGKCDGNAQGHAANQGDQFMHCGTSRD